MAHIDRESGELVVRIVYDGAPSAGKTTSLRAVHAALLATRDGSVHTPTDGETTRETTYFDWRDFRGGFIDGRPLRCQLLTVPGQLARRDRRALLLEEADAVVFVVDASEEALDASRRAFESLARSSSAPRVVQLNKIDRPAPASEALVRRLLALGDDVPVHEASALEGRGVSQAFLSAMRLAAERVRADLASLPTRPTPTHDALLATMRARRGELARSAADAEWPAMWPMATLLDEDVRALFRSAHPTTLDAREATWTTDAWWIRTSDDDTFESEADARAALAQRLHTAPRDDAHAFVLTRDDELVRLWSLTRRG